MYIFPGFLSYISEHRNIQNLYLKIHPNSNVIECRKKIDLYCDLIIDTNEFSINFFLNLYFDKINQPGQHLQVTFHVFFKSDLLFDRKNPEN